MTLPEADNQSGEPSYPNLKPADRFSIAEAADLLRAGALVAFPTETVYGLGADAKNGKAVARIFEAKGRPHFNPLIVHVLDLDSAEALGHFGDKAKRIASAYWPGPLTLVVPRKEHCGISELASAGLPTLAIRVPAHGVSRALLQAAGVPIAAPSANRSGHVSATSAAHVAEDLGTRAPLILDAGPAPHGLESTILDVTGDVVAILRPGAVTSEAIEAVLGEKLRIHQTPENHHPMAPGQLASHYAPNARLRLNASDVQAGEALLAFGSLAAAQTSGLSGPIISLSDSGDLIEAAANLFAALRTLDASGVSQIAVMPIPEIGLGVAINDRLRRAAAPR